MSSVFRESAVATLEQRTTTNETKISQNTTQITTNTNAITNIEDEIEISTATQTAFKNLGWTPPAGGSN